MNVIVTFKILYILVSLDSLHKGPPEWEEVKLLLAVLLWVFDP